MEQHPTEMKRTLGLIDATSLVAGSMIGSGIFLVTVYMAQDVGAAGWVIFLWLLTGVITLAAALSYGELAGMMPNAGGQYVYLRRAFGPPIAFMYGWTVFSVIQTGVIAAVAVAFANYSAEFAPSLKEPWFSLGGGFFIKGSQIVGVGLILFLTFLNSRGVQYGRVIQVGFTFTKLVALLALIVLGISIGLSTGRLQENFAHPWDAFHWTKNVDTGQWSAAPLTGIALLGVMGATLINSLFSSDAWNNVTFIAGEIKDPRRNIPRSLFLGTLIVTVLYILANVAYFALLPMQGDPNGSDPASRGILFAADDRVGTAAASMIFGPYAVALMAGLIMISTFGCNNGIVLAGGRLFYAMAKDKLFFQKAGELNSRQVPGFALWLQCAWACVLALSGKYNDLLTYATFASLLFYILTIGGIFVLRKKEPNTERPYKAFGYPILPLLYILCAVGICVALLVYQPLNAGLGLGIALAGLPIYYLTQARHHQDPSPK